MCVVGRYLQPARLLDGRDIGGTRRFEKSDRESEIEVTLFSCSGRLAWQRRVLLSDNLRVFECQAPSAGVYFLEVTWQGKREVAKVVSLGN